MPPKGLDQMQETDCRSVLTLCKRQHGGAASLQTAYEHEESTFRAQFSASHDSSSPVFRREVSHRMLVHKGTVHTVQSARQ